MQKRLFSALFLSCLMVCGFASPAAMAAWTRITTDQLSASYADMESIERSGNRAKMSLMMDYFQAQQDPMGSKVQSLAGDYLFSCKDMRYKQNSLTLFSDHLGTGKTVSDKTYAHAKWHQVPPESAIEVAWGIACNQKVDNSQTPKLGVGRLK